MSNPGKEHWKWVKWLLCYLIGASEVAMCFSINKLVLEGFVDVDLGDVQILEKALLYMFSLLEAH